MQKFYILFIYNIKCLIRAISEITGITYLKLKEAFNFF